MVGKKTEKRLNFLLKQVLSCPRCQSNTLASMDGSFFCHTCTWKSQLIKGDTPSFATLIYDSPRDQTRRVSSSRSRFRGRFPWLKEVIKRATPWRDWIYKDISYWREAIMPLRRQELIIAQQLLHEYIPEPKPVLLELGVGFQDHVDFYEQLAENVISSDIYRDSQAAQSYNEIPRILYCLINVEQLPIQESSIDILFSSHVVEHFPDREENLGALHLALKPGAIACHIVPISIGFLLGHLVGTVANFITLRPLIGRGVHGEYDSVWQEIQQTTLHSWRSLFEKCGFEILKDNPGTLGLTPLRPRLTLRLSKMFHLYGSWVFVMRAIK